MSGNLRKIKQPYYIHDVNHPLVGMAGPREHRADGEYSINSCGIITQEANQKLSTIHDRMSIILKSSAYKDWLNVEEDEVSVIQAILKLTENNRICYFPVSTQMNKATHNQPDCIK